MTLTDAIYVLTRPYEFSDELQEEAERVVAASVDDDDDCSEESELRKYNLVRG